MTKEQIDKANEWGKTPFGMKWKLEYQKRYRKENWENYKKTELARYHKKRKILDEIKGSIGCVICGEKDPCCLDWHHVDVETKILPVSCLLQNSMEYIFREIEKCILLCANCHRKEHRLESK
jgi:hypothetical protein